MTKLSKKDLATRDELVKKLADALDAYNAVVVEVQNFRDDIVSSMDDYYNDRSDKWQESERGSEYETWKAEWEGADIEEYESELIEVLEQLPKAVGA